MLKDIFTNTNMPSFRIDDANIETRHDDHKSVNAGKFNGFNTSRINREEREYTKKNVDKSCNTLLSLATGSNDTIESKQTIPSKITPVGFKEERIKQLESKKKKELRQLNKDKKKTRNIRKKKTPKSIK